MRHDPGRRPRAADAAAQALVTIRATGKNPWVVDAALAVVVAVLQEAGALALPGAGLPDHLAVLAGSLALALRRRAPIAVLLTVTACMLFYAVRNDPARRRASPS
nr:hypothetical protein GCM10020093_070770 [Planobispora longispora]